MDFFERQEIARRHTKLLVVYFVLAVIGIIAAVYLAVAIIFAGYGLKHHSAATTPDVIAEKFSHILNGEMRLNLRLMGLVFGIWCLAILGRILLETRSNRSRDRNPLPLLGLALLAIGGIGVFFGKLIKSAVSRQREFLADAAAVQFTRNPGGLASALKKVGGCGSRIEDPNSADA